jgi:hypothetical protein
MVGEQVDAQQSDGSHSPRWVGGVIAGVGAVSAIATRSLMNLDLDCHDEPEACGPRMTDAIEHPLVWLFILMFAYGIYRVVRPARL